MIAGRGAGWALLVTAALVLAGGVAHAAPPGAPIASAPGRCAGTAAEAAAAVALARRCSREVEVVSARTEWNTTTALPNGSIRLEASTSAVRARKGSGWAKIDSSIAAAGGVLTVGSAVTPMRFSDGSGDEPFATIERDGHTLSFDMPFDLPKPKVDGRTLTYGDVLPGVDLVVTVNDDATGFSEVLRVESAKAAANPRLKDLRFAVDTSHGVVLRASGGGFSATDASGATVFTSPAPAMWDSSTDLEAGSSDRALGVVDANPAVQPVGDEEIVALPARVASDEVAITPSSRILTGAATVWPVYIDPGVSGTLNRHSAVRTVYGIKYNFTGDEGVGLCNQSDPYGSSCSATFKSRLLYQFAGLQGLGDLDAGDILSATFGVTGTHSYSCTPRPVTLYAVADFDQNTAYPGGGYWSAVDTKVIAHRAGCAAGLEPRLIEFNAISQAQAVARAGTAVASFGIAADEGSMASWKRYDQNATFSVTYNRAPNPPASLSTVTTTPAACVSGATRPLIRSTSVSLAAVLSDPDATNVQGSFSIVNMTSGASWTATSGAQASGLKHSVAVPPSFLFNGSTYRWTVSATDGSKTGTSGGCEFTVDTAPPVAPGVAAVTGVTGVAVYPRDGLVGAGGLGQEGRWTFSNGGSTDVVSYQHTFTGGPTNNTPIGQTMVGFRPTSVGSNILTVQAIDLAGNVGPASTYRFSVAFPTVSDAWMLDETSGATATNLMPGGAGPLTLSAGTEHVNGPGAELSVPAGAADRALRFDGVADTASASGPVVATDKDYAVMAFVKLDDLDGDYTAVSQDGSQVSAFELGYRNGAACPAVTNGHCWAFSVPGSDSAGAPSIAYSTIPARVGSWVLLTGVREAGTISVSACEARSTNPRQNGVPELFKSSPAPESWNSSGAFQVGRGLGVGAPARSWHGSVSQVATFRNMVSDKLGESTAAGYFANKARRMCSYPWDLPENKGTVLDAPVAPTAPGNPPPIPDPVEHDTTPNPVAPPAAANAKGIDLDGSGTADVFWSSMQDGQWRTSYGGVAPWSVLNYAGAIPSSSFKFADFDGDNRDDVFLAWNGAWLVSDSGTASWRVINHSSVVGSDLLLGDFNGDKKADVFWSNATDGYWYISYGGTGTWQKTANVNPGLTTASFKVGDFNGDGKSDIFFANPGNGQWWVSDSATSAWRYLNTGSVANDALKLGDFNGDGRADVFMSHPSNGQWWISYGGNTGWTSVNYAGLIPTSSFQFADFNGDGKDDVFLPWNGAWLVSNSATSGWRTINSAVEAGGEVRVS